MRAEEGDVGNADECPSLTGPELYDRALLGDLGGSVKISETDTAEVRRKANQNVPENRHPPPEKQEKFSNMTSVKLSNTSLFFKISLSFTFYPKSPIGLLHTLCLQAKNTENKENYKTLAYPQSKPSAAFWSLSTLQSWLEMLRFSTLDKRPQFAG